MAEIRYCVICAAPIERKGARPPRFCPDCLKARERARVALYRADPAWAAADRARRAEASRRKNAQAVKPPCNYCGSPVAIRGATKCRSEACRRAYNNARAKRYGYARRARHAGVPRYSVNRPAIMERDGWRCGLCGGAIERALSYPHPQSATLDHVIPLALGGAHAPENLQAAHLICNQVKGPRAQK